MTREIEVADADDLPDEGSFIIGDSEEIEVAVFRVDGEYHAMLNYCPHQGGPLCADGPTGRAVRDLDDETWSYEPEQKYVECPWHSWKFDVTTGQSTSDKSMSVPTFDVKERDGKLFIEL